MIAEIWQFISRIDVKSWPGGISAIAFVLSVVSFRQKSIESRLALRKQLTETLLKFSNLKTESGKSATKPADYPHDYFRLINAQRRFLIKQAVFIAGKIRKLVAPFEYLLIANVLVELEEFEQIDPFFQCATRERNSPLERGVALRDYGSGLESRHAREASGAGAA